MRNLRGLFVYYLQPRRGCCHFIFQRNDRFQRCASLVINVPARDKELQVVAREIRKRGRIKFFVALADGKRQRLMRRKPYAKAIVIRSLSDWRSGALREFPLIVFVARVFEVDRARTIRLVDQLINFAANVVVVGLNELSLVLGAVRTRIVVVFREVFQIMNGIVD